MEDRAAKLADETGLEIPVCHFPPGTSKWNKIEHRLFSFITINWRGKPLVPLETIINLIAATTTSTGLEGLRPPRRTHLPQQDQSHRRRTRRRQPHTATPFHPEWNYTIKPRP